MCRSVASPRQTLRLVLFSVSSEYSWFVDCTMAPPGVMRRHYQPTTRTRKTTNVLTTLRISVSVTMSLVGDVRDFVTKHRLDFLPFHRSQESCTVIRRDSRSLGPDVCVLDHFCP